MHHFISSSCSQARTHVFVFFGLCRIFATNKCICLSPRLALSYPISSSVKSCRLRNKNTTAQKQATKPGNQADRPHTHTSFPQLTRSSSQRTLSNVRRSPQGSQGFHRSSPSLSCQCLPFVPSLVFNEPTRNHRPLALHDVTYFAKSGEGNLRCFLSLDLSCEIWVDWTCFFFAFFWHVMWCCVCACSQGFGVCLCTLLLFRCLVLVCCLSMCLRVCSMTPPTHPFSNLPLTTYNLLLLFSARPDNLY